MNVNNLSRDSVFATLGTGPGGLGEAEAGRRAAEFGPNEIERVKREPLYRKLLKQFTHFLAILLWAAAALSFVSEYFNPGEGMSRLGAAILAVIFINAVFTFIQEYRAEKALESLMRLLPYQVSVIREGRERKESAQRLVPGDVIALREGDKIPADARLIESVGIRVDNSVLTGESEPVPRTDTPDDAKTFFESANIVFAGTTMLTGSGVAVVYATAMRTEIGRIAKLTESVSPGLSPLEREIIKVSRIVATIASAMGVIFFLVGYLAGRTFWETFLFSVGIVIANVPEGLLPTVTLSLAMGAQRMAKRKALIKTLTSVETLGSIDVICTDKTGTLTENRMTVRESVSFSGSPAMLGRIAVLCNNARLIEGNLTGDPTETALYRGAGDVLNGIVATRQGEIPFDSGRKMMSTVHEIDGVRYVMTKGAPENVFGICTHIDSPSGVVEFNEASRGQASKQYHELMARGLRVLAFAYRPLGAGDAHGVAPDIERDMVLEGLIGLEDPPRPEVKEAVRKCRGAGIGIIMITGDSAVTAVAIGREIGLVSAAEPRVIEGAEMPGMSDAALREALSSFEVVFARMMPKHKLRVVNALKEEGHRVAVTGDGVNDAPALKRADIGIAMGSGTDVAKEASDMILLDDNFATIVNAVEEGRAVYENIRKFISYIFASNIPEVVPYIMYVLFSIPLPLTIMQILAVDLGTDMLPALALGTERPGGDIMKSPPRRPDDRLLSFPLLTRAYLFLGPIEAVAGMCGYFIVLYSGGWQWNAPMSMDDPLYLSATTACLVAIIISQIGNVFACRSFRESIFDIGMFSNRLILYSIVAELAIILLIVYTPYGNRIFGTYELDMWVWLALIPFAFVLLAAEELRKMYVRRQYAL